MYLEEIPSNMLKSVVLKTEPNKPYDFLQTDQTLIATNICSLLRGPLSIKPIPCPILLKLELIISPYLVQVTRPNPLTRKLIKLIFGSCLQPNLLASLA